MASELRVTTLSNATGNGPAALTNQAAAKAKLLFSQSSTLFTGGDNHSLNISSSTDHATGIFSINYSSNFTDKAYPAAATSDGGQTTFGVSVVGYNDGGTYASDWRRSDGAVCGTRNINDNSAIDRTYNGVTVHGDLA